MRRFACKCGLTGRLTQLSLLALSLAIGSPIPASADTFTYTYVGIPFGVWFDSECPPQCNLTGSMTFAQPLPSNLPWATRLLTVDPPLSYSFSDGLNTYTSANSSFESLYPGYPSVPLVGTGSSENIIFWSFALVNSSGLQLITQAYPVCGIYGCGTSGFDSVIINTPYGTGLQAGASGPGTWSGPVENKSPTPEPSSLFLFGAGLVAVTGLGLSRKWPS
jgi:hypothetical protein